MRAAQLLRDYEESRWLEALEWHALRCSTAQMTAAQRIAWHAWLQDPDNRQVYASCARLHRDAQAVDMPTLRDRAGAPRVPRPQDRTARVLRWAGTAGAIAATVCALIIADPTGSRRPRAPMQARAAAPTLYRTGPGQTRRIRLTDGSIVILGAATALDVSLTPRTRTVTLEGGEAWFHVVHRPHWPFVVTAGNGTIRDLGTAFVVDREPGRLEVTVTQGRVEVSVHAPSMQRRVRANGVEPIQLHRGERLIYSRGPHPALDHVDPRLALAWTTGRLEFADEPLQSIVENVDRYSHYPIRVSPAAAGLHLTTLVISSRIPAWLEGLGRVVPVTVVRNDGTVCIRLQTSIRTHLSNECTDP